MKYNYWKAYGLNINFTLAREKMENVSIVAEKYE
jgi:hypothetical protein